LLGGDDYKKEALQRAAKERAEIVKKYKNVCAACVVS